jgi:hypothetical protein
MPRLFVFLAVPDQNVILAGRNLGWRQDVFHSWRRHRQAFASVRLGMKRAIFGWRVRVVVAAALAAPAGVPGDGGLGLPSSGDGTRHNAVTDRSGTKFFRGDLGPKPLPASTLASHGAAIKAQGWRASLFRGRDGFGWRVFS